MSSPPFLSARLKMPSFVKIFLAGFVTLFLLSNAAHTQDIYLTDQYKKAYKEVLSLRFEKAKAIISIEQEQHFENLFGLYLENYIGFLSVFISEEEEKYDKFLDNKENRIDRLDDLTANSPVASYVLGNIYLQSAVARSKFRDYFMAALDFNRAYRLLADEDAVSRDFLPNKISLGVLHIMIGLVPDKYRWILKLVNMEGSVEQGKKELELALNQATSTNEYNYLVPEILFYLGFTELNVHPDTTRINYLLRQIDSLSAHNLLLSYLEINILMRTGNNDQVVTKFENLPGPEGYFPFYYLHYLHAECYLRKLTTDSATIHYEIFLNNFKGENYRMDAGRKLAWVALLKGDTAGYHKQMNLISVSRSARVGQDQDALREKLSGVVPNTHLLKARLLFDGGYYQKAREALDAADTLHLTDEQKTELIYRKARIAHKQGKFNPAIDLYEKTIRQGMGSLRYFAANSALKLGEIYEKQLNYTRAVYYYKLCLDMNFDEYESGIHSMAKAGLKRVSD